MSKEKNFQKYFGVPLEELLSREKGVVPKLLQKLAKYLLEHGIDTEGIFRVNGSSKNVEKLRSQFDKKGDADLYSMNDPYSVASLLKMFLRELPDTLIPASMTHKFVAVQQASVKDTKVKLTVGIRDLINTLPLANKRTLKYLVAFLVLATLHSPLSKMNPSAISTVFGPNVFKCGTGFSGLKEQGETNCVMLQMMNKYDDIFLSHHHRTQLSPHHPQFSLDGLLKELSEERSSVPVSNLPMYEKGGGDGRIEGGKGERGGVAKGEYMYDITNSFINDSYSTPPKCRNLFGSEPLFSEIVQKHIDRIVNKYLHNNVSDSDEELTDSPDTFYTASKVIPSRSPNKTSKKFLSSSCLNVNNNISSSNDKKSNKLDKNNDNNNNNNKLKIAHSVDNLKTKKTKNHKKIKKKVEEQFSLSEEEDEEEERNRRRDDDDDDDDDDSVGLDNISSSCENEDEKNEEGEEEEEEDDDDDDDDDDDNDDDEDDNDSETIKDTTNHHRKPSSRKSQDEKEEGRRGRRSASTSDRSSEGRRSGRRRGVVLSSNESNDILKAKALNRSIQINNQKLHKLESSYEEERGRKLRHDDAGVKTLKRNIQQAKSQLQDLGRECDKGASLEHPISISETFNILMQRLQARRQAAARPEDPLRMTAREVMDEKVAVQKVLLQLEGLHGRPNTAATKGIVLPLYERYRLIKKLLASKSTTSNVESEPSFDSNHHSRKSSRNSQRSENASDHHHHHHHHHHNRNNHSFDETTDAKNYNTLPLASLEAELEDAKSSKKELQVLLQHFEQSFAIKHGRKILKADQMMKEKDYRRYKNTKSKIKLLEVLVAKKQKQQQQ